jgi:hypothetical protein
VYVVADHDLNIYEKDLNPFSTDIKVRTKMANLKVLNVPYTMALSYYTIEKKAVLVETTADASVIIIDNYKHSSDSTMILPFEYLSETYIISTVKKAGSEHYNVQFAIAAFKTSTEVTILFQMKPNLPLIVDGIEYENGSEMVIKLNELETYQIMHNVDLSGTFIKASSNVAIFSGSRCEKIVFQNRSKSGACSHLVEQMPPVNRLDNTYIVPPNIKRYGTILKVVSPSRNRVMQAVASKKTTALLTPKGHFEFAITGNDVAVIESEQPVLVTSFATGSDKSGDPYMITVPGVNQYLHKYTVVVPDKFTNNYMALMIEHISLPYLTINDRGLNDYVKRFEAFVRVRGVRYFVLVVSVPEGAVIVKTTNNAVFGLLVYGHRENDGYGFAGNVVLPDD